MYQGELLRAGKVYEINEATAIRWIVSNLASEVTSKQENETSSS